VPFKEHFRTFSKRFCDFRLKQDHVRPKATSMAQDSRRAPTLTSKASNCGRIRHDLSSLCRFDRTNLKGRIAKWKARHAGLPSPLSSLSVFGLSRF
jgi:hypothetical protein